MPQGLIQFADAKLKDVSFPDNLKVLNCVAVVEAPLSAENAAKLKCGSLFKPNGDPIEAVGKYSPSIKLSDIDLLLPSGTNDGIDTFRPTVIRSFQITPKDDLHLTIQFRAHISGVKRGADLFAIRVKTLGKKFECAIRSLQEEFNFSDEGGGTRSGGDDDDENESNEADERQMSLDDQAPATCELCDQGVPKNHEGLHMPGDGSLRDCDLGNVPEVIESEEPAEANEEGPRVPAIADALMVTGRKPKKQRTRGEMAEPTPEELQAMVAVEE